MCRTDGAVAAYPSNVFEETFGHVRDKVHESQAPVLRRVLGSALEVPVDSAYRFIIPEFLRSYAKIVVPGKAVLIGTGKCFEVWERAAFALYGQAAFTDQVVSQEAARAGVPELI
jgi:DNA-binding transcriptional regulator/RsmH inhibitor MraZ